MGLWYYSILRSCRIFSINSSITLQLESIGLDIIEANRALTQEVGNPIQNMIEHSNIEKASEIFPGWIHGCPIQLVSGLAQRGV